MSEVITEFRNENTKNIDLLSSLEIVQKINECTVLKWHPVNFVPIKETTRRTS